VGLAMEALRSRGDKKAIPRGNILTSKVRETP
jgi:hypothetical protein